MRNILALAAFACLGLIAARPGRAGAQNAVTVGYPAGWNLVAAPEGTSFAAALGPLYTLQSGDTAYRRSAPTAAVQAAFGYWAYFPQPSVVLLTGPSPASLSVVLPPRQYVMIGDPSLQPVAVSPGADLLLTYDATSHTYAAATSLVAGQGAWAYSDRGVTLTLTILTPPLPPPPSITLPRAGSKIVIIDFSLVFLSSAFYGTLPIGVFAVSEKRSTLNLPLLHRHLLWLDL